ncbi:hypothetical protein WJX72_010313 [[Myrmecia] bisecta]|uniref:Uncharacterized protein n=1 Tax=[Myrmecia] bisecta TaxID=41462 RepID=A0AAW1PQP9_9CHLO
MKAARRLVEDQVLAQLLQSFQDGLQAAALERNVTLEELIKKHPSNFDKDLDLHRLALRVPTFKEGSLKSILDQAAELASTREIASVTLQDLNAVLDQLLETTTRPWSNDGVLLPWIDKDGTINKANLGKSITRIRDLPAQEALRRRKNVLSLPQDKQAEELLGCQSAGVLCAMAGAHPKIYLQPKLELPSREME